MNKKSAIATAGGLVASFVAGIAAVSFNWGIGTPSAASTTSAPTGATTAPVKPIVKHRTITVHKKAPASKTSPSPAAPQTVVMAAQPAAVAPAPVTTTSGSTAGGSEGDDGEREGGDD